MKIGFVLDDTLDSTDGVQQYVLTLGVWLSGQGHEVHYLVGHTTRTDMTSVHSLSRNMNVRFNGNRMSMPLPASRRRIKALLAREQFDILHVQMPYSPWLAHRIIMAAPASTAIMGTFHIAPHTSLVNRATKALALWTRQSLRRFDGIVSVSTAAADFARTTYGIETTVLPNVVTISEFSNAQPFPRYASKPTIVYLGRLMPRKGCQVLLEAVSRLRATDPDLDFQVVICGRGPLESTLKSFVARHNLADRVEFTGYISESDKPKYLKSADLAVFPSSGGESFGIVLIEAMAVKGPVVLAAQNAGYGAVLAPYPDVLFKVDDAAELANKICTYLTDPRKHARALKWQASYGPQFDVAVVGEKLLKQYKRAQQKRTSRSNETVRQ
ncbi:MAG TPA: glycosyltransferase family 4 protein [Candidatus Saccharimonadales bacterium]|jgi:phosphatidylinositol alpha-mannosyltransferase